LELEGCNPVWVTDTRKVKNIITLVVFLSAFFDLLNISTSIYDIIYIYLCEKGDIMYEILILFLILVDQVSKIKIESLLKTGGSVPVIDGFFNLTYVQNRGAAFGLFQDKQTVFIMVAVLVVVLGLAYIHKSKATRLAKLSISFIIAGAVGNVIDRSRLGYVIDFFDFKFIWNYVFNFADVLVVVGTFLLAIYILFFDKE